MTTTDTKQGETLELLSCPFCGVVPTMQSHTQEDEMDKGRYVFFVECDNGQCPMGLVSTGGPFKDDNKAAECWNTRTAVAEAQQIVFPGEEKFRKALAPFAAATSSPTPAASRVPDMAEPKSEAERICVHCQRQVESSKYGPPINDIVWSHIHNGVVWCHWPTTPEKAREIYAAPPESTRVEEEQEFDAWWDEYQRPWLPNGVAGYEHAKRAWMAAASVIRAFTSDSARRAAGEIEIEFPQLPNYSADKVAAIISKHFTAAVVPVEKSSPIEGEQWRQGMRDAAKEICDACADEYRYGRAHKIEDSTRWWHGEHADFQCEAGSIWHALTESPITATAPADNDAERLRWLLKRIIADLPKNRDWLDPDVEEEARELTTTKGDR